jgi:hypothetical protein
VLALFLTTNRSDLTPTMLKEVSILAGSACLARSVAISFDSSDDIDELCDRTVAAFLNHRVVTHLLSQLTLAGLDLSAMTVAKRVWDRCSTSTVVRPLSAGLDGRVTLKAISEALDAHRSLQRGIVTLLSRSFSTSFLLMYGQGIAIAHPAYSERFSHDIDLLVTDPGHGQGIVDALNDLGFVTSGSRSGSYGHAGFNDWRLDAANFRGHKMHIDISTTTVSNSTVWTRPLVLPDIFATAQAVTGPSGGAQPILVPSDTHQLVLICEKAQRNHRYDARVRCDAAVLVRGELLDVAAAAQTARQFGLTGSLGWALRASETGSGRRHSWQDLASSALIAAMAQRTYGSSPAHDVAARVFGALRR